MRWRRPVVVTLAGAAALVMLQAVLSVGLLSRAFVRLVQPVLEERLGPGTTVQAVSVRLFPPRLVLDQLLVPRATTTGPPEITDLPLLTARRVTSTILPWQPLDLVVEAPVLVVSGSLGKIEKLVTSQAARPMGQIHVRNAAVTIVDPISGRRLELSTVDADVTTELPGADLTISAQHVKVVLPGFSPQFNKMTAKLRLTVNAVQVLTLDLTGQRSHVRITGAVKVGRAGELGLDLALDTLVNFDDLGRPGGLIGEVRLSANVQGTPAAPVVEGSLTTTPLVTKTTPVGEIATQFSYRDKSLLLSEFNARIFQAQLSGPAELTDGHLMIHTLHWRDRPLGPLVADLEVSGDRVIIRRAVLSQETTLYRAQGEILLTDLAHPALDLQVEVAHFDPRIILGHNDLRTQIGGRGRLTGPLEALTSRWTLSLARGRVYGIRFDRGEIEMALERGGVTISALTFERGKPRHAHAARVTGSGRVVAGELVELDAEIQNWNPLELLPRRQATMMRILLAGQHLTGRLRGAATLTGFTLQLETTAHGRWEATIGSHGAQFTGTFNQVSLTGRIERAAGYPVQLAAGLSGTPMSLILNRFSPPLGHRIVGAVTGEVKAQGLLNDNKSWMVDATLSSVSLSVSGTELRNMVPVTLTVRKNRVELSPVVFTGEETSLTLSGSANLPAGIEVQTNGEVGLRLLKALAPHVSNGHGIAQLTLRATGSPTDPEVYGRLLAYRGEIQGATLARTIKLSALGVRFLGRAVALDTLEGELDQGRFQVQGLVRLAQLSPTAFSVRLRLNEIVVDRSPSLLLSLAGELLFEGDQTDADLSGTLTVTRGTYEDPVTAEPLSAALSDLLRAAAKTRLNVKISGSQDIHIKRRLGTNPPIFFEAPVDVDLILNGTVEQPLLLGKIVGRTGTVFYSRE